MLRPFLRGPEAHQLLCELRIDGSVYGGLDPARTKALDCDRPMVTELGGGFVCLFAFPDAPYLELARSGKAPREADANSFVGEAVAELVSLDTRGVVGRLEAEVYSFSPMLAALPRREAERCFAAASPERAALLAALCLSEELRLSLDGAESQTLDFEFSLFHLRRVGVEPAWRGRGLGAGLINLLCGYASIEEACEYALNRPAPLAYESGSFAAAPAGAPPLSEPLHAYCLRRGFRPVCDGSDWLCKALPETEWDEGLPPDAGAGRGHLS